MARTAYLGARLHDGHAFRDGDVLLVEDGICAGIVTAGDVPAGVRRVVLDGGVICPGFVDLQVNGGGGAMLNDAPDVATLRTIADAHRRTGTASLLPTLITDTPGITRRAVDAAVRAVDGGVDGIAGLHLEGPHLSQARKGAHDPALIRPMEPGDLEFLCAAAARLPTLYLTLAPESVRPEQIAALVRAGATVSLGHTDADYDTCRAAFRAGARAATHLFNAMRGLDHRAPGLVGAVLDTPGVIAGVIADGIHVHPAAIRVALASRPGDLVLVSDAMAVAGTARDAFALNGRRIERRAGRLTLADGTLAGADLDLPRALGVMVGTVGIPLGDAIVMATSGPARLLRDPGATGTLTPGAPFAAVHLDTIRWIARPLAPRPD